MTKLTRGVVFAMAGAAAVYGAASFTIGRTVAASSAAGEIARERRILYYIDPMHPAYRSDRPGHAPDCGMDLEPVYADASPASAALPVLALRDGQERAAAFETELVRVTEIRRAWQTAGRVVADEARIVHVSAGVDGWVRRIYSDRTGQAVATGQPLAAVYSKDLSAPQQAYVYALDSYERLSHAAPASQAERATTVAASASDNEPLALATQQLATARDNLRFYGMGEGQIDALGRRRREFADFDISAPAAGQIIERRIAVGQRFMKGELLYRIADLSHVWVDADIRPDDGMPGDVVSAQVILGDGTSLAAAVAGSQPPVTPGGYTSILRLALANPRGRLVPGMVVNVTLEGPPRPAVTVPASALIDGGRTRHVFVAQGQGRYELRGVETGWQRGDRVEIRSGLADGERVVTTGAFLLDSESRLHSLGEGRP